LGAFSPDEVIENARADDKEFIAETRQISPLVAELEFMLTGYAADEIVKAVKDWLTGIVMIGGHGRGGVLRAVIGIIAETVTRHVPRPIVIFKAGE
jgi:nucleotide-binding universal stress UspA family protein